MCLHPPENRDVLSSQYEFLCFLCLYLHPSWGPEHKSCICVCVCVCSSASRFLQTDCVLLCVTKHWSIFQLNDRNSIKMCVFAYVCPPSLSPLSLSLSFSLSLLCLYLSGVLNFSLHSKCQFTDQGGLCFVTVPFGRVVWRDCGLMAVDGASAGLQDTTKKWQLSCR